jgi:hypothetical protein
VKSKFEIVSINGRYALVDCVASIKPGSTVVNINKGNTLKAITMDTTYMDGTKIKNPIPCYIGHGGASRLYFRESIHRRFVKYITQRDLLKINSKK